MTLNEYAIEYGPKAHQILEVTGIVWFLLVPKIDDSLIRLRLLSQALTLRSAGDVLHLERLETLGDSLLKYLVSVSTFVKCAGMNEGHLTKLKGQLVSNQYLFYCGKKLDIGSYVKVRNGFLNEVICFEIDKRTFFFFRRV